MTRLSQLSRSVQGRTVIVTGAASGMGRATAHLFADEGANVAVTDVAVDGAAVVADEIVAAGGVAIAWALDVQDGEQVRSAVGEVANRFDGIDILVNNAGVSIAAPIDFDGYEAAWETTLDINLRGYTRMIRAALPYLLASDAARIVNIASTEGIGASRYISPYSAAKHGVIGLTRGLAVELGARGITVNCVCPGPIHTGMTESIPDDAKERFARRNVPLRRYGIPEEVAHATLSLTLPAMSFVNAAVLVVDGGMTAKND